MADEQEIKINISGDDIWNEIIREDMARIHANLVRAALLSRKMPQRAYYLFGASIRECFRLNPCFLK